MIIWEKLIIEPIFNLLVGVQALIPGHNFGIALILTVLVIKLFLYPITKRQYRAIKKQQELQPELKRIQKKYKDNRQMAAFETLALYRNNNCNPLSLFGYLLLQIPILIGFFVVIRVIFAAYVLGDAENWSTVFGKTYGVIENNSNFIQELASNPKLFNPELFGILDLSRLTVSDGGIYIGGIIIIALTVVFQFLTSRQTLAANKADQPKQSPLKNIKKSWQDAKDGKEVSQEEISQSFNQLMIKVLPIVVAVVSVRFYLGIVLSWLVQNVVTYFQHKKIDHNKQTVKATIAGSRTEGTIRQPNAKEKKSQRKKAQSGYNRSSGRKRVVAKVKPKNK